MCAALRSLKASKLPRRVLPSTATATKPSEADGVEIDDACWRNAAYYAAGSTPWRINRNPV
jgi:hypothetical protein